MTIESLIEQIKFDLKEHGLDKKIVTRRIENCDKLLRQIKKDPTKDYTQQLSTIISRAIGVVPYAVYNEWERGLQKCKTKTKC